MVFGPIPGEGDAAVIAMSITMDTTQFGKALIEAEQAAAKSASVIAKKYDLMSHSVDQAAERIQALATHYGRSVGSIIKDTTLMREQVTQNEKEIKQFQESVGGAMETTAEGAKKATDATKTLESALKKLSVAGVALMVLRKVWSGIVSIVKEALDTFGQFTIENFKLQVGIRAAQRLMGEAAGTTEEWTGYIQELRQQFQIFSTKDLTAATSKVILLTRELGFTADQMKEVTKASIVLAEISGFKVEEAARRLTLFLDTGYTRGLAQLGLQISKSTVEHYALAEGIDKTWNEMSRAERAALSLGVVIEQTGRLVDDAGRIVETYQGKIMAMEAAQTDAFMAMGEDLQALELGWKQMETNIIVRVLPRMTAGIRGFVSAWIMGMAALVAPMMGFIVTVKETAHLITQGEFAEASEFIINFADNVVSSFKNMTRELHEELLPAVSDLGNVLPSEMAQFAEGLRDGEDALTSFEDVFDEVVKTLERGWKRFQDGWTRARERFERSIEKLNTDFAYKMIDAARGLGFKLLDINRKFADRREAAWRKYYDDIAMLSWKTANKIAEAQADFRYNELKEQREFDLEMERMQRKYLFDLEDAIRERDARAVLNIMRRFQEDQRQAGEDFELGKIERAEALQQELAEIRRNEEIRRMELKRTLELRLRDLEIQRLRERAIARENYQRELVEIAENEKRRREAIHKIWEQRKADLIAEWQAVRDEMIALIIETQEITQESIEGFIGALKTYFGGVTAEIFAFIAHLRGAINTLATAIPGGAAFPTHEDFRLSQYNRGVGTSVGGFAEGGGMIASKPTTATFGEAGPELGSFIPLNKLGQVLGGAGGGDGAKVELTVKAEDGFYVEVADQVMGEMADVIVNTERGR